jgi:hypothetical protein
MPLYRGSCHCGAVQFEIETEITDLYVCDCSLCSKKNALMTSVHEDNFKLIAGEDKLSLYQWNAKIARHFFCSVCGIYPFHKKRSMPDHYGVNVRCLAGFDHTSIAVRRADGKTMSVVAKNRRSDWTGPRE